MLDFIEGKVSYILSNYVVINVNGLGYKIYVPKVYNYKIDEVVKIYLYNYIREDEYSLYGFLSLEERYLFLKLIDVKGLGPKIALTILASSSYEGVIDAINKENILYLKKFPKVGEKLARQIILDLKGKLISKDDTINEVDSELSEVLLSLGYKKQDFKGVIKNIDYTKSIEEQVKEALKLLLR